MKTKELQELAVAYMDQNNYDSDWSRLPASYDPCTYLCMRNSCQLASFKIWEEGNKIMGVVHPGKGNFEINL